MRITFCKRTSRGRIRNADSYDITRDGVVMGVVQQSSDRTWFWYTLRGQPYNSIGRGDMTLDDAKAAVKEWFKGDQHGT